MHIELIRFHKSKESLDGKLLVDGAKLCDTSENAATALPPGKYHIVRHFCKQYNRYVPLIMVAEPRVYREHCRTEVKNVKLLSVKHVKSDKSTLETFCDNCPKQKYVSNNTNLPKFCPQFCPGNGIHGRNDGSIILGTRIIPGCIKHPREPYENLMERIRKISGRGNSVTLTIKDI